LYNKKLTRKLHIRKHSKRELQILTYYRLFIRECQGQLSKQLEW